MKLFKRELPCDICEQEMDKRHLCKYEDPDFVSGMHCKQQQLCPNCALNRLLNEFLQATERAVVIRPSPKNNSYVFYSLERMKQSIDPDELINHIISAIPKESEVCERCGSAAVFTWCSDDIMGGDVWDWQGPYPKTYEHEYLCPNCLASAFKQTVEANNIELSFIHPYENQVGFATPWDC